MGHRDLKKSPEFSQMCEEFNKIHSNWMIDAHIKEIKKVQLECTAIIQVDFNHSWRQISLKEENNHHSEIIENLLVCIEFHHHEPVHEVFRSLEPCYTIYFLKINKEQPAYCLKKSFWKVKILISAVFKNEQRSNGWWRVHNEVHSIPNVETISLISWIELNIRSYSR